MNSRTINIDYVARVEGEASVEVCLDEVSQLTLRIFEPPRFFEGFLVGRKFDEIGDIVSRICGICPVSHMTTAILAIERAMGIEVSQQTRALRNIMSISQIVASHLIHLYMLAMPDYHGLPGIVQMQEKFGQQVLRLVHIKDIINELTALIGGRALHPVTHLPGGFTKIPSQEQFEAVLKKLKLILPVAQDVATDIASFEIPAFGPDMVFAAIVDENEYAINNGRIRTSSGKELTVEEYATYFYEEEVGYAFAKKTFCRNESRELMTGALARINTKIDQLPLGAKQIAAEVGPKFPSNNIFHNLFAQALEIAGGIEQCVYIIERLDINDEQRHCPVRAGAGGAITEAPRGLLYHYYEMDTEGFVRKANIITPTSHNFAGIEANLKRLVLQYRDLPKPELTLLCEKMVRAYDPCFSCSVH